MNPRNHPDHSSLRRLGALGHHCFCPDQAKFSTQSTKSTCFGTAPDGILIAVADGLAKAGPPDQVTRQQLRALAFEIPPAPVGGASTGTLEKDPRSSQRCLARCRVRMELKFVGGWEPALEFQNYAAETSPGSVGAWERMLDAPLPLGWH